MDRGAYAEFGKHFVIGLQPSPDLTDHDKRLLSALKPAGVILFRANFEHGAAYDAWLARYERLIGDVALCLETSHFLLAIDHEHGRVFRTPAPITRFAAARQWPSQAAAIGAATAVELRSLGLNVNFAPVVDVVSPGADSPAIGDRSFGDDPAAVATAALAYIDALQAGGVLACPKHFPGHGDTSVDSHHALPAVHAPMEVLRRRELEPFRRVAPHVKLIMTAHIVFDAIEPGVPATLSKRALTDILRGELGYRGAVISDDLGMRAVAPFFADDAAPAKAIIAGCDLLEICAAAADTSRALEMASAVARHAREPGAPAALAQSRARVDDFLAGLGPISIRRLADDVFARHARLAPLHQGAAPSPSPG